jgi:hypothetical protein
MLLRLGVLFAALAVGCCCMTHMPRKTFTGPLPPLSAADAALRDRLRGHVDELAGRIGERNVWRPRELAAAASYIQDRLCGPGRDVAPQEYDGHGARVRNIEASQPGIGAAGEIVVVGAHYDSVMGSPGANDNGSGVAALIEIAASLAQRRTRRTLRFVAFVNEEPPFFRTERMGSRVYAARCRRRNERVVAMLSLETIGFYADVPGSQHYPFPFGLLYPATGNFIGFVGNLASRSLLHQTLGCFRDRAAFPSEGVAAPGWLTGIGWSDHESFWKQGYPAVMITDTAPFRYPHYHALTDTPDKIDYDRMARVVGGVTEVVADLAGAIPAKTPANEREP